MIKANLASLVAFVDSLVLEPGIPVFDYWLTFFESPEFSADDASADPNRILTTCATVIVPVSVTPDIWAPLRNDVFVAMRNAAAISGDASKIIEKNLTAMHLEIPSEARRRKSCSQAVIPRPVRKTAGQQPSLCRASFSSYAARAEGTQVLSPDQSDALLLASSGDLAESLLTRLSDAGHLSARKPGQGGLFDKLNEIIGDEIIPVTLHRPCFLRTFSTRALERPRALSPRLSRCG